MTYLLTDVGMTLFNDRISRDPMKHKLEMVRTAVENGDLLIAAAYGSSKDVSIYQSINVPADRIFVVGKIKSRLQNRARFVSDGYALHLGKSKTPSVFVDLPVCSLLTAELSKPGVIRASKSNSRHLIRRACFNLPKLASLTTTQSASSLINTQQPSSPSGHSTKSIPPAPYQAFTEDSPSLPLTNRKANINDSNHLPHTPLIFNQSQAKSAPSRGISPRMNRNAAVITTTTIKSNNVYNPSSIERV